MKLNTLCLTNFKNYQYLSLQTVDSIVCFVGQNGEGKTNLLDSIYYLCIGKSYFNHVEMHCMMHDTDFLRLEGTFELEQGKQAQIVTISPKQKRKQIQKNQVAYDRVSDHLGFAPVCFVAPDDAKLILSTSDERRRFMNATLSQINPKYVQVLTTYRKILNQRNALLKTDNIDTGLLSTYDQQLAPLGQDIHAIRAAYFELFSKQVQEVYRSISQDKEQVSCIYSSQLSGEDLLQLLKEHQQKDIVLQRSSVGVHKDNLLFKINGKSLKTYGSQGQQKTFLLALKLAELNMISQAINKRPIFLLDDIFDKLDALRIEELFRYILNQDYGQLFITDTDGQRLQSLLSKFNRKFVIFIVDNQQLVPYAQ